MIINILLLRYFCDNMCSDGAGVLFYYYFFEGAIFIRSFFSLIHFIKRRQKNYFMYYILNSRSRREREVDAVTINLIIM